jgi:hypothetical protein
VVRGVQPPSRRAVSSSTAWRMPRGWSMLHCSLMDRCIDRCRNGLVWLGRFVVVARNGGVGVGQLGVVLGVLGDPQAGQLFRWPPSGLAVSVLA